MVAPGLQTVQRKTRSAIVEAPPRLSINAQQIVEARPASGREPQRIGELIPQLLERYGLAANVATDSFAHEPGRERVSAELPVGAPLGLLPTSPHWECFAW